MSLTLREAASIDTGYAYGGAADAIGGVATLVLAICGLAGINPPLMAVIATIVFGAALLIHSASLRAHYSQASLPTGRTEGFSGDGGGAFSGIFLAGAAGVVLGVLALLGVESAVLAPAAAIAYGAALMLGAATTRRLRALRHVMTGAAGDMAWGSANIQALGGLAAIVLGVLAVLGNNVNDLLLDLIALLTLAVAIILTGSTFNAAMMGAARSWTRL
ncbi:hypothetical protein [Methylosinus sp. Sm6]|uniref:hypothetical protein n=1 Tax=Methylosinus sp. Sm6 TaxID=2866948 RepID=UPI001C99873A|nr:hypothetical protein [Methylosinus sp. Sm6]MBY6241824.1 hypothetical protein [Methylosinus sp. Sm6]